MTSFDFLTQDKRFEAFSVAKDEATRNLLAQLGATR